MNKNKLPVEISDKDLPQDKMNMNDDFSFNNDNAGFVSLIFLIPIMVTCVMWGMVIVMMVRG